MKIDPKKTLRHFLKDFWFAPADAFLRTHEAYLWPLQDVVQPILDIGCGDGKTSQLVYKHLPKIEVGLDLDPTGADSSPLYKKIVTADASQKIPFPAASFQTVISNSTLEHIPDDKKAIAQIARVLKKNGLFIFTVPSPNLNAFLKKQIKDLKEVKKINQRLAHFHYRSLSEWEKILEKNNLKIIQSKTYFSPASTKAWFNLFQVATTQIYRRELWSYLSESVIFKKIFQNLIRWGELIYLTSKLDQIWDKNGSWQLIIAKKE